MQCVVEEAAEDRINELTVVAHDEPREAAELQLRPQTPSDHPTAAHIEKSGDGF